MTPYLLAAKFAADEYLIRHGLKCVEEGTKNCTDEQIKLLHIAGVIPTGLYNYLMAIRE